MAWLGSLVLLGAGGLVVALSAHALHRLQLVAALYARRAPTEATSLPSELPTITVQLPIFNERDVVDRLIDAACALDWPADRLEIQVLDDGHEKYREWLKPWQRHGSVYGISASTGSTAALRPVGEWNDEEIVVDGRRVKVTLNGTVIQDVDLDEASKAGTLSGKEHPGLKRTAGHIGFLGHGDHVEYRDIRIKVLPATPARKNS